MTQVSDCQRVAQSEGLSVREAEHHLDANLFLDVYPWWKAGGPHRPEDVFYMLQNQARKRWSGQFAEATSKEPLGQMLGWMYLPSSLWDTRPPGENTIAVQWGVPAEGVAWPSTMWTRMGTGVSPGHLVLCGRAPPAKEGAAMPEGGQEWGPTRTSHPTTEKRPNKEDCGVMTPMTMTLLRPGRPIRRFWQLPTCLKKG